MQVTDILKWIATVILIIGTAFNSMGYYPLGPMLLLLGGIIWLIVSIMWKEPALIITNMFMAVVAVCGFLYKFYG